MTMTAGWTGYKGKDIAHTCGGKATGTIHRLSGDDYEPVPVGNSVEVVPKNPQLAAYSYRVTLCPGVPFAPTPSTFPQGDFEYRQFTAYRTSVATDQLSPWRCPRPEVRITSRPKAQSGSCGRWSSPSTDIDESLGCRPWGFGRRRCQVGRGADGGCLSRRWWPSSRPSGQRARPPRRLHR